MRRIVLASSLAAAPVAVPAIGIAQQPEWRSADHVAAIPRAELDSITARGRPEYIVTRSYYFRVDVNGHIAAYDRDTTRH